MGRFEINFLDEHTDEALSTEIQRIAATFFGASLTKRLFNTLSGRVSASTICKRFGGWREALVAAGAGHLYNGRSITEKVRNNRVAREMSETDLVVELQRVQSIVGKDVLSIEEFNRLSVTSVGAIRGKFGTWQKALAAAGISQSTHAKRYSDEECFENLAAVWTHYGRPPQYLEMNQLPSVVGPKAYVVRWGTWRKSLKVFVDWANAESDGDSETPQDATTSEDEKSAGPKPTVKSVRKEDDCREVRPGLRFKVFMRDRFRCIACGRSPAMHLNIELHADHVVSVCDKGKTTLENLQTLCQNCNLGKGKISIR